MHAFRPTTLALALLAGLAVAGGVIAQSAAPTPAQQKELDAARAELDGAAKRYAELARKYHATDAPMHIEQRIVRKPVLGVLFAPDPEGGVRIAGVTPDSGAAKAGLKSGDRITMIDGKALTGANADARLEAARAQLRDLDAGTPVRVHYVRDGRNAVASVRPQLDERVFVFNDMDGSLSKLGGAVSILRGAHGRMEIEAESMEVDTSQMRHAMDRAMGALSTEMPRIQTEILRLGDCKDGGKCRFPMLTEAFRWSGLNLASLDSQLGRYFGTAAGVLVLSTGDDLAGLQAGDVVQKIDGKAVSSPREAMAALRARPAGSKVRVDYLRDRKAASAQVEVPEAAPLRIPAPPAPPAPPPPPPALDAAAPPAPPAAPTPPDAPQRVERRKIVVVDQDGKRREWEGDANDPLPAWAPKDAQRVERRKVVMVDKDGNRTHGEDDGRAPLPAGAQRIEQRRMVFVDENGKTTVLEGDDAPPMPEPPAPPAPPAPPTPPPPPSPPPGG